MKTTLVVIGVLAIGAVCTVAGCRLLSRRSTEATIPFCTHGGGDAGRFYADLRKSCPEAKVLDGLSLRGSNQIERRLGVGVNARHTENDVVEWLNRLFQ